VLGWWSNRRLAIDAPPPSRVEQGRLPGVFWIAAAMLFCTTPPEWCITAWGATFVADAADVSTDTAVALMAGYFGGVLAGRTLGSRLARRHDPARLLAFALALTGAGLAVPWPSTAPATVLLGLALLGIGLGNLFPMGLGVPSRSHRSGRRWRAGVPWRCPPSRCCSRRSPSGRWRTRPRWTAALGIVPVTLVLAAAALALVCRAG
jgi:hypothetical protein